MVARVYRRTPTTVGAERVPLGYLDFDRQTRRAVRYTPTGTVIDRSDPWQTNFDTWLQSYQEYWTTDATHAYVYMDPDMTMDEGL